MNWLDLCRRSQSGGSQFGTRRFLDHNAMEFQTTHQTRFRDVALSQRGPLHSNATFSAEPLLKTASAKVPFGSLWAAHKDRAGLVTGWEERGPQWRGFATGGSKRLFQFGATNPKRLCVTEAAIDALSLAAIEAAANSQCCRDTLCQHRWRLVAEHRCAAS